MIKSYRSNQLKRFYVRGQPQVMAASVRTKLERMLDLLDAASDVSELDLPGWRLHQLEPKSSDRWAVDVNANWRLTFRFEGGHASDVDFEDYH